jgi:uncharacterized protein (DUF1499 family)
VKLLERVVRIGLVVAVVAAAVYFGGRFAVSVVGSEPGILGLDADAERGGCPGTPNCVSSYAETEEHAIDPIACDADRDTAIAAFHDAISTLPDVERLDPTHWVVYSRIFRFPDDVRIETSARGIEVFSASRLGSGDMGVNRNRVEELRDVLAEDERCQ